METDSRNFQPHHPENRGCAGGKTTPVVGGKLGVLETGIEKMKVNDPGNGECFCDIKPEQPLHRSRINRVPLPWSRRVLSKWERASRRKFQFGKADVQSRYERAGLIDW